MSVLRSKRQVSQSEFENTFSILYKYSRIQTSKVPVRRQRWLCTDITQTMNTIYEDVMSMSEYYDCGFLPRNEYRAKTAIRCINNLCSLQKPLLVLWNVSGMKTKKMVTWISLINKEVELMQSFSDYESDGFFILDWKKISELNFLSNMSALHRYTHGKVSNSKKKYNGTDGSLLISLVDSAFYNVMLANRKKPTTRDEYLRRKKSITKAISDLEATNRPLLFFFNTMECSESVMTEWSGMLRAEIKLLKGVLNSDEQRFGNL